MGFRNVYPVLEDAVAELKEQGAGSSRIRAIGGTALWRLRCGAFSASVSSLRVCRGRRGRLDLYQSSTAWQARSSEGDRGREIEDRFGALLPPEVEHLLGAVRIRLAAARMGRGRSA